MLQVMAWCCQATWHYLSQCWPISRSPYDVTRPQLVNFLKIYLWQCHASRFLGNIFVYKIYPSENNLAWKRLKFQRIRNTYLVCLSLFRFGQVCRLIYIRGITVLQKSYGLGACLCFLFCHLANFRPQHDESSVRYKHLKDAWYW